MIQIQTAKAPVPKWAMASFQPQLVAAGSLFSAVPVLCDTGPPSVNAKKKKKEKKKEKSLFIKQKSDIKVKQNGKNSGEIKTRGTLYSMVGPFHTDPMLGWPPELVVGARRASGGGPQWTSFRTPASPLTAKSNVSCETAD